jgi:hypothetical protein
LHSQEEESKESRKATLIDRRNCFSILNVIVLGLGWAILRAIMSVTSWWGSGNLKNFFFYIWIKKKKEYYFKFYITSGMCVVYPTS